MYNKNCPETIQSMFDNIAKPYDRANLVISLGLYKWWNQKLIALVNRNKPIDVLLDLCAGTGEVAFEHLKKAPTPQTAYLLDFSHLMLEEAKRKAKNLSLEKHTLHFIEGDAQAIPLPDGSVTGATVAYGIRNVKDPAKCASEVLRTLAPGGVWGILELTRPKNGLLRSIHSAYLKGILPQLGKLVTSNEAAYSYLSNSINNFIEPDELEKILKEAGFSEVSRHPLVGGVATVFLAKKSG